MKCRSLYKDDIKQNYNLVFFKSKGLRLPFALYIQINNNSPKEVVCKESSKGQLTDGIAYEFVSETSDSYLKIIANTSSQVDINLYFIKDKTSQKMPFSSFVIKADVSNEYMFDFKKFAISIPAEKNYAGLQEGTAYSLIQRLSVLKNELWWQINYGIPLLEKVKNKNIFDSVIINIILNHPDVTNIIYLNSFVQGNQYYFEVKVSTVYSEDILLSNTISG